MPLPPSRFAPNWPETAPGGWTNARLILTAALVAVLAIPALAQRPAATIAGDPSTGKALFDSKGCATCHSADGRGGRNGPDLSWIGMLRVDASLRQSIVDPNAQVYPNFYTVVVKTQTGETAEGLALREDDTSIQIAGESGRPRSFVKAELAELRKEPRSLMPSYGSTLSPDEVEHLVAYLATLKAIRPTESGERTRDIAPVSENVNFFDRPERDAEEQSPALIDALGIREGDAIADIGAGTGYFTWRLAEHAGPRGTVVAVDIQQAMLDRAAETVRRHGLTNVKYVLAGETDPKLPSRAFDLVFIAYSYHEFAEPEATLAAVRRSLKPGGRLVVVEYARESPRVPASPLHAMTFDEMRSEIEPMGFDLDRILDFLPVQHGLVFKVR